MGLDIAFNREKAIAAGLQLSKMANGTEDSIAAAQECEDADYLAWLQREEEVVHVPGTNMVTTNDGVSAIVIRANKWGSIYGPMTTWLKANNIEWTEF